MMIMMMMMMDRHYCNAKEGRFDDERCSKTSSSSSFLFARKTDTNVQ